MVDPSGRNYDDYLWWVYYDDVTENLAESGGSVNGLSKLSGLEMMQTHEWITKGVDFAGDWQVEDFRLVLKGMEMIDYTLGGKATDWLGLRSGLVIVKTNTSGGRNIDGKIQLGKLNWNGCTLNPRDLIYVFIHEAGHRIMDMSMGLGDGITWWAGKVKGWSDSGNYMYVFTENIGDLFSEYGAQEPADDFAEMFVWYVLTTNPGEKHDQITEYKLNWNPSKDRQNMIKAFFNIHNHPRSVHVGR